jgi:hypothetical protein
MTSFDRRGPGPPHRTTGILRAIASGPSGTTPFISRSRLVHRGMTSLPPLITTGPRETKALIRVIRAVHPRMTCGPREITTGPRETKALIRVIRAAHPRMTCGPREITRLVPASTSGLIVLGPLIRNLKATTNDSTGFIPISSGLLIGIKRPLRGTTPLLEHAGRILPIRTGSKSGRTPVTMIMTTFIRHGRGLVTWILSLVRGGSIIQTRRRASTRHLKKLASARRHLESLRHGSASSVTTVSPLSNGLAREPRRPSWRMDDGVSVRYGREKRTSETLSQTATLK